MILFLCCDFVIQKKVKWLGYVLYKNKVYKYHAWKENLCNAVIIDDKYSTKVVPLKYCRVFIDAYMMAKYNKNWYALPNKLNIENGKIMLIGEYQDGFQFLYTDGGFPVYQKQICFPDDVSDIVLKVVETKKKERRRNTYQVPIFRVNWNSHDLIHDILEMTFVLGLCPAVNIAEMQ